MGVIEDTIQSLGRVRGFNASALSRRDKLGESFAFDAAVGPAQKTIDLFAKIPSQAIEEFPDALLKVIKDQADSLYNLFEQVAAFDPQQGNAVQVRDSIIKNIRNSYNLAFPNLYPFISYGVARTVDFSNLETQGRAVIQGIQDQTKGVLGEIEKAKSEATVVLDEIKKTAAEQGVSQQAYYFAMEAEGQESESNKWMWITLCWAAALVVYGVGSFFFHKIPWLTPSGVPEAIGFVASKVLIFAVLSYMLILSARNFLSHKHNAVVNKHRQNALQTFNALADASRGHGTHDIVLNHAAACIFAPQDSGYIKPGGAGSSPISMDLLPRPTVRVVEGGSPSS